jgi:hypothetical protein
MGPVSISPAMRRNFADDHVADLAFGMAGDDVDDL